MNGQITSLEQVKQLAAKFFAAEPAAASIVYTMFAGESFAFAVEVNRELETYTPGTRG